MFFPDYSLRDHEIVDYQFYRLPPFDDLRFRGPPVPPADLEAGRYFTAVGGAQVLGVMARKPYPQLLAERIGLPALNLGLGGGGPEFYCEQQPLLDYVNGGRFVVLQVMTARTAANSRLKPVGVELVQDVQTGLQETTVSAWARLLVEEREKLPRYIAESQANWLDTYRELLAKISVPVILYFFSPKPRDEQINYEAADFYQLFGSFPQFVTTEMVARIASECDCYAECRSSRNQGHRLISRFTGRPTEVDFGVLHPSIPAEIHTHNTHYPSQEMHEDGAEALLAVIRDPQYRALFADIGN